MQKTGILLWMLVCGILIFDIGNACVRAQVSSSSIKSKEVDIVNASGQTVIQLVGAADGPEINLSDPNGRMRMGVGTPLNGGEVVFWDANSNDITMLGGTDQKKGLMDALGFIPSGEANVGLVSESDSDGLTISDKSGKERASISYIPKDEAAEFATQAANSKSGIFAGTYGIRAHVVFDDPNGTPRTDFGIEPSNNAYFALGGKDGTVAWQKTFDPDGSPAAIGDNSSDSNDDNNSGATVHALKQRNGN